MCLTCMSVAGVQRRGGRGGRGARGGERHRELSAQELQSFLLHGESSDLFLQSPVFHLQLVQGLQHSHNWT